MLVQGYNRTWNQSSLQHDAVLFTGRYEKQSLLTSCSNQLYFLNADAAWDDSYVRAIPTHISKQFLEIDVDIKLVSSTVRIWACKEKKT